MKTPVARISSSKHAGLFLLLIGGSLYILSMPFWEAGGLKGLIAGHNHGFWWPLAAVAAIVSLILSAWTLVLSRRSAEPAIFVQDNNLHYRHWRAPLPLSDIKRVQTFEQDGRSRFQPMIVLTLRSGEFREIPYVLFDKDMIATAALIAEAAGLTRRTDEPVTGP